MPRPPRRLRRVLLTSTGGALVMCVVGAYLLTRPVSSVVKSETFAVPQASAAQLEQVAALRVFFGHQSVGRNVLDAVPAVYAAAGLAAPAVVQATDAEAASEAAIQHA